MKVIVTGATGFVGRHLIPKLVANGHQVTATARDVNRAKSFEWFGRVDFVSADLQLNYYPVIEALKGASVLVHLAWPGLPNYQASFHVFQNLDSDLRFLKAAIESGLPRLLVAGTCLEYGLQSGPLTEEMATQPVTAYGFAKDSLRKSLEFLQHDSDFILQWMRLFYIYGDGQNPKSLLAQLDVAINQQRAAFNMSIGTQLRDYLPVEMAAHNICLAVENPKISGIINCSSGIPISILDLVRRRCKEMNSDIHLNTGYYTVPPYEPLEFWGVPSKLRKFNCKNADRWSTK